MRETKSVPSQRGSNHHRVRLQSSESQKLNWNLEVDFGEGKPEKQEKNLLELFRILQIVIVTDHYCKKWKNKNKQNLEKPVYFEVNSPGRSVLQAYFFEHPKCPPGQSDMVTPTDFFQKF